MKVFMESSTLKEVLKYGNHPSIISILHSFLEGSSSISSCSYKNTVLKEIRNLNSYATHKTLIYQWKFQKKMLVTYKIYLYLDLIHTPKLYRIELKWINSIFDHINVFNSSDKKLSNQINFSWSINQVYIEFKWSLSRWILIFVVLM